ncbi:MAG: hypothetical protein L6V84_09165 [Oscillospiraceae bacterium]|nr:MAG: hypothetical protein L6V84_09165 [Oscillospiraceae bacterium]
MESLFDGIVCDVSADYYRSNVSRTLYAVWEKIPETYTVSYFANGGTGAPAAQTKNRDIGSDAFLGHSDAQRVISSSAGAKTVPDRRIISRERNYSVNESMTLSAVWGRFHTYVITFHPNGGKNAPGSVTKTYGNDLISACRSTDKGQIRFSRLEHQPESNPHRPGRQAALYRGRETLRFMRSGETLLRLFRRLI